LAPLYNSETTQYYIQLQRLKQYANTTGSGPHYTLQEVCAASALLNKGGPAALDALGIIPGEGNLLKGVQLGAGLVSAGLAVFGNSSLEVGVSSGVGLGLSAAEPYAKNVALNGVKAVPILGNTLSVFSTYRDIKGPDGMGAYYDDCMAGKN
jgi:hypothetical protein